MTELQHFENFIGTCQNILNSAPHFSSDTSNSDWREESTYLHTEIANSKEQLKRLFVFEKNPNKSLILHLQFELNKLFEKLTKYKVEHKMFNSTIMPLNHWFVDLYLLITEYIEWFENFSTPFQDSTKKKDYKEDIWFKVGVKFATGEIDELYKKYKTGSKVAKHLGNKSFRPYITTTLGGSVKTDKNIFYNDEKVLLIYDYCIKHQIPLTEKFKSRYDKIQLD